MNGHAHRESNIHIPMRAVWTSYHSFPAEVLNYEQSETRLKRSLAEMARIDLIPVGRCNGTDR